MFFLFILLPVIESTLLYGFKWMNFDFNSSDEKNAYEDGKVYRDCLPTGIRMNSNSDLFMIIPRKNPLIPATLSKFVSKNDQLLLFPYPSWWANNLSNPDGFQSITAFEIDPADNFWLVDQERKLLIHLDHLGELVFEYDLSAATSNLTKLEDLALDLFRNFAYISDSGTPGIIVLDMSEKSARLMFKDHFSVEPNDGFWMTVNGSRVYDNSSYSVGVSGIALSCDKRDLYYSPVSSRELYAIGTQFIRNPNETRYLLHVMPLGFKNTASQGVIISEKGDMYLTDLQYGNVLYYEQMMPYPEYFLVYFLQDTMNDTYVNWPYALTFNNVKRTLLVLANQAQNFNANLIDFDSPLHGEFNFYIYEIDVDDRSYLYGCQDVVSVHSAIAIPVWVFALISVITLILITIGICAVKHYRMIKRRHKTLIYN